MLLPPAWKRRQTQPLRDDAVHVLEQLQEELLILLLQRARRPAHGRNARTGLVRALEGKRGQHGSTWNVTTWSARSFFSRSSTASAMACASATFAAGSTEIVTSA